MGAESGSELEEVKLAIASLHEKFVSQGFVETSEEKEFRISSLREKFI